VPTAKDVSGPAAPLDPPVVDHYQCYKVRGTAVACRTSRSRTSSAPTSPT
jgi:hypothetical protein